MIVYWEFQKPLNSTQMIFIFLWYFHSKYQSVNKILDWELNPIKKFLEFVAARRAVLFVQKIGPGNSIWRWFRLEVAVNALKKDDILNSTLGHLIKDTIFFINYLQSWYLSDTYRQGNAITHELGELGYLFRF